MGIEVGIGALLAEVGLDLGLGLGIGELLGIGGGAAAGLGAAEIGAGIGAAELGAGLGAAEIGGGILGGAEAAGAGVAAAEAGGGILGGELAGAAVGGLGAPMGLGAAELGAGIGPFATEVIPAAGLAVGDATTGAAIAEAGALAPGGLPGGQSMGGVAQAALAQEGAPAAAKAGGGVLGALGSGVQTAAGLGSLALGGAGIMSAMGKGNQAGPQENKLSGLSDQEASIAKLNFERAEQGIISPAQQAMIDRWTKEQKNQLYQYYAQQGRDPTHSTDYRQGSAQIDAKAIEMHQQFIDAAFKNAMAAAGGASANMQALMREEIARENALSDALFKASGALGNIFGGMARMQPRAA